MSILQATVVVPEPAEPKGPDPYPLVHGQRLDQPTFHDLYEQTSPKVKAELIGGVVYVASPVGSVHSAEHGRLVGVGFMYAAATPGVEMHDNGTVILGPDSEPQPDVMLRRVRGGTTHLGRRGTETTYVAGPPEFVAEVSYSTEAIDLNQKRDDYDRHGVGEYLVHRVRARAAVLFGRDAAGRLVELPPDADGLLRSRVLPGLWIDPMALVAGDSARLLAVLNAGLASPEHAAFVASLAATSPPP
jgi:Uma2 family endonuclease